MARQPRFDLPGIPQHIVQRGNNRMPCFLGDADRRAYLHLLGEALRDTGCRLHAYVLMDNHVHLLATPGERGAASRLMQKLGRRYVALFNRRHERTGTLWEGRFRSCLVDADRSLLRCARYIDLNPVRARMVPDPAAYPWSGCAAMCALRLDPLLTLHPVQLALGQDAGERGEAYRAILDESVSREELDAIRAHLRQQRAWGPERFRAMVERKTQRFAGVRPAHRPRRQHPTKSEPDPV